MKNSAVRRTQSRTPTATPHTPDRPFTSNADVRYTGLAAIMDNIDGSMSDAQFAQALGCSTECLDALKDTSGALAVNDHGERRWPRWQIDGHRILPGLRAVITSLRSRNMCAWTIVSFLVCHGTHPHDRRSNLEHLERHRLRLVLRAARRFTYDSSTEVPV